MYNISLLCPTKNRVTSLKRMWDSALETADQPDKLELVLYIDYDDNNTLNFIQSNNNNQLKILISDKEKTEIYSNLHNICCKESRADIVFGCADDLIFRSKNWDKIIIEIFNNLDDKIAFIYGNDGYWGSKFGTHGFFHKKWFNTLGYLSPPLFTVDYSDNYVNDIAKAINRCFFVEDIFIEHMHWTFGKMEFDNTALQGHKHRLNTNNANIYNNTAEKQNEDIQKLKRIINV